MDLTKVIIYIQNKIIFKKNINLQSQDFDGTDVKQYYLGFSRNILSVKQNLQNLTIFHNNSIANASLFNYIEYYINYFDFFQNLPTNIPEKDYINQNNEIKLLYYYYQFILYLYKQKDLNENNIYKLEQDMNNITIKDKSLKSFLKVKCYSILIDKLNSFNLFNIQRSKHFIFIMDIIDYRIKEGIFDSNTKKLIVDLIISIQNTNKISDLLYFSYLRALFIDALFLSSSTLKIINDEIIITTTKDNQKLYKVIYPYLKIYKKITNEKIYDENLINYTLNLLNNPKKLNESKFYEALKRKNLNELIYNKKLPKDIIKICLFVFKNLFYPLDALISYLTVIYNGLICKTFYPISILSNIEITLNKEFYDSLDYDNDNEFKNVIYNEVINHIFKNIKTYKFSKISSIPLFQLLILKIILWKINFEMKLKNYYRILLISHRYFILFDLLMLNLNIKEIFEVYILLNKYIGDCYFNLHYYKKSNHIYNKILNLIDRKENNYSSKFIPFLLYKIRICKHYYGDKQSSLLITDYERKMLNI